MAVQGFFCGGNMDKEGELILRLELKYCERCGALWLRTAGGQESYCVDCFAQLQNWPKAKESSKRRRAAHRNKHRSRDLQGVAEEWTADERSGHEIQMPACDTGEEV
jgi:hypothetical protein